MRRLFTKGIRQISVVATQPDLLPEMLPDLPLGWLPDLRHEMQPGWQLEKRPDLRP
jgi:hypothetical protein